MSDAPNSTTGDSSLRRGLELLDAFSIDRPEMSIRELSNKSGTPRSTTHRLVQDLIGWGALERTPMGVRLGVKLFELGAMAPGQATLREITAPSLHALSEVSHLTANLAVRDGMRILYLDKISTTSLRVPHSRLGGSGYLHATALGKAILAYSGSDIVEKVLSRSLESPTAKTITAPERLRSELKGVRRTGLAFDLEESRTGLFCVAAAVLDRTGRAVAAVSVTGATAQAQAERYAPVVLATARTISKRLQHTD